ncbi:MAG: DUF4423 domain-containing protein [Bdellovibrionales bacterium]|nr:DUF4423 domain-containing protein [Bdellovibrionales bacterium]
MDWIKPRLRGKVLDSEIRRALEFLESAGFFKRNADDSVRPLLKDISCMGGVYKVALGQFHREMLTQAADAIHELKGDQRWISGHSVALSRENYEKAVSLLTEALERIGALDAADRATEEVYHFGLFAIPLTRPKPPEQDG